MLARGGGRIRVEATAIYRDDVLRYAAWSFVVTAALPKLAYRLRWPTRLGPGGLLLYIAFNTALGLALRTWAVPFFQRLADRRERANDQLRHQLGREPTGQELHAYLVGGFRASG